MMPMIKKTEDSEAIVENTSKQERETIEEEENLNINKKNLKKEEEDKIHLTIIKTNIMTDIAEAVAILEIEKVSEEKVMIEETPEVGVETASTEAEAIPLKIGVHHQTEEEVNLKEEEATVNITTKETILEITPETAPETEPQPDPTSEQDAAPTENTSADSSSEETSKPTTDPEA